MRDLPGLEASPAALERLAALEGLVRRWTARINLVAPSTLPDLWTRHIVDSAQLWPLAPPGAGLWADLGAGGGFPGLVVAALAAERGAPRVALVEADARKCAFLREAVRQLSLPAVVHHARAETLPPLGADVVSARALAPLPALLPLVARHLATDGVALLPKGRAWQEEEGAAREAGWRFAAEALPSATDASARILRLREIARG
nr:16S rRNA (guanine(527)-N(7))-methyltransferase RsmG [Rubellimicrobium sp. CFH 75288]